MKTIVKTMLLVIIVCALSPSFASASSGEANTYVDAATKKYMRGKYAEALTNLEKAHDLDPKNDKIKDFTVKILLEAASQNRLAKNYQQANEYLDKAKTLDPDNPKVREMDKLLNPSKVKAAEEKDKNLQPQKTGESKQQGKSLEEQLRQISKKQVETSGEMEKRIQELVEKQQKAAKLGFAQQVVSRIKEWQIWFFALWSILATVSSAVFLIFIVVKYSELKDNEKRLTIQDTQLKTAVEEKNNLSLEIEKVKERFKYEHQAVENLQKEIEENKKHEEQFLKAEFDNKNKEMEQRIRAEIMKKYLAPEGQKEKFVQHQEEKFVKYVNDTVAPEAEADPIVASARERIALMAQNLYEYAPGAAVEFITKMARNENPLIRTNIVQALANIAKPETFELLFDLYNDSDLRVKREVLRNLKHLNQKIMNGEIALEPPVAEKIKDMLVKEKGRGEWIV